LAYKRYALLDGIDPKFHRTAMSRFVYDPRNNYFYARVPKAANSSVVAALAAQSGDPFGREYQDTWKVGMNILPTRREYERAFRFTVVRNPTDRALSGFLDKAIRRTKEGLPLFDDTPAGFTKFMEFRRDSSFVKCNAHFIPQSQLVPSYGGGMHEIGRLETIGADLPRILTAIFGSTGNLPQERHHATGASSKIETYMSEESTKLLRELYAQDYETFGYDLP
jgi:hypothetical protein